MSSLVPCADCHRHVRHHERRCPFCGAERTPSRPARRDGTAARDATRATLIALGLTMVGQACGGKEPERNPRDNVGVIPPYGLVPFPEAGSGGGGAGGAGGDGGASGSDGEGGNSGIVPPYGAMPPEPDAGSDDGDDAPDSGTPPDAGAEDAGETP